MQEARPIFASPRANFASGAALAALWLFFAVAHVTAFQHTGRPSLLLFCVAESVTAAFLLLRTAPKSFSTSPTEWVVALLGTFLPLLLRPTGNALMGGADWGVVVGASIQIAGALSLNRSIALVPALRELKTHGLYSVVRHPIYASYVITFSSYLAANFSPANLAVYAASLALLVGRIRFEEGHLRRDPAYRRYQQRVRWRLIPFVF